MKTTLLLPILFFIAQFSNAQGIKGFITDDKEQPVPYANIYVPELKTGTTSNIDGKFELKLPEGEWKVLFQYIGFKTVTQSFNIGNNITEVKITMQPQSVKIPEIKVLATGEDPAYYVMRHAIAMAPYYTSQVSEYECKLYLKGTGNFYKIPRLLKKQFKKEGIKEGDRFVLETLSNIHFELPDNLKQEVIAMRSSGDDMNTSPMQMITNSLYDVSDYGISSPVSKNAMSEYKFKLTGVFEDQGKIINQIQVTPKTKKQGVFSGTINIVENYWNIYSADLDFSMPMMDVTMHQIYGLVEKNTWMPTSLDFSIDLKALGIGMKYIYVASLSDYSVQLNPKLDHSFLDKINQMEENEKLAADSLNQPEVEMLGSEPVVSKNKEKIESLMNQESMSNRDMRKLERLMDKEVERSLPPEPLEIPNPVKVIPGALKNNSSFWSVIRPIPLTENEQESFAGKDSLNEIRQTPEYKDSIRDVNRKFKLKDLILGRTYRYVEDSVRFNSYLSTSGIINPTGLTFNTVNGFTYSLPFSYSLTDTTGKRLWTRLNVAYAFSRKAVNTDFLIYRQYSGIKRSWLSLSGGITTTDFKRKAPMSSMENDIYTLFFEDNFQKFYENRFLNFLWGGELVNGLNIRTGVQFSDRRQLQNHSDYKFINSKKRDYTPNIPDISHLDLAQLESSKSTSAQMRLSYTPRQHYRIRNNVKYPAYSDWPTFTLYYEKGIHNLLGSDVNFDFISARINHSFSAGVTGYFETNITGGGFLNNKKLFAPDFKYFDANNQLLQLSNSTNRFYLLDYYTSIQSGAFLEAHVTYASEKLLLKRLPLLNRTMLQENLFVNYLNTNHKNNFCELGYSLNNIFLMMDAMFVIGFENQKYQSAGVKISINLQ